MELVGILLAAGRGRRFDASARRLKLLEPLALGPIAAVAADKLRAAVGAVIAVVRSDPDPEQERLRRLLLACGCTLAYCSAPEAEEGIGASIACAVRARPDCGGWIVALADMPQVQPATLAAVRSAIAGGAACAAPYYRGKRGHPVGFGAVCRAELAALSGDAGARAVLARHGPARIAVDDPGILVDIDSPEDLLMLRRTSANGIA